MKDIFLINSKNLKYKKIIGDWGLGKKFYGFSNIKSQKYRYKLEY